MKYSIYKKEYKENPKTVDGRFHYVYRIKNLITLKYYYGSRTSKDEPKKDIGLKYFTSSKYIKDDFKNNTQNYSIKIIKIFDNPEDKIMYESFLHAKFNVKNHKKFLNKSNQSKSGFDTTGKLVVENSKGYELIDVTEYNKNKHKRIMSGKVSATDKKGNKALISVEEYHKNRGSYIHASEGKIPVMDKEGKNLYIGIDEFHKNRELYTHASDGIIPVMDREGKSVQISVEEYHKNRESYIHYSEGKVMVVNKDGKNIRITSEEYKKGNYDSILKNKVCIVKADGSKEYVTSEEYIKNKTKYKVHSSDKVVAIDKDGNKFTLSKEEFDKSDDIKGHTAGFMSCKHIITGETKQLHKEEFIKSVEYVGINNKVNYDDVVYIKDNKIVAKIFKVKNTRTNTIELMNHKQLTLKLPKIDKTFPIGKKYRFHIILEII